jgi:hypothetical protein
MIAIEWIRPEDWFNALEGIDFVLIVAILLALVAFIYGICRITEMGLVGKKLLWRVTGIPFGFLIFFYLLYNLDNIEAGHWVEISLLAGLVGVTVLYASTTFTQAKASAKMAEAMTKPMLIPHLKITSDFDKERYVIFSAGVHNDGNGPAYDIEFWLENDSKPPSILLSSGSKVIVLRARDSTAWAVPDPKLFFPKSDKVQRRFFVVKYRDAVGEYLIKQPFVLTTSEYNKPIARLESISLEPFNETKPVKKTKLRRLIQRLFRRSNNAKS